MAANPELVLIRPALPNPELGEPPRQRPRGGLLDLTPTQVTEFEQAVNAKFGYEPGLTGVTYVPLQRDGSINPVKVYDLPQTASDNLSHNRAIAKIGHVLTYWQLVQDALHTGKYDLSRFQSFNMLPIYLGEDYEPYVVKKPIPEWSNLYGKSEYSDSIPMINYGGDADFTGLFGPNYRVKIRMPDGENMYVDYSAIGVSATSAQLVFDRSRQLHQAQRSENNDIVQSGLSFFPEEVRRLVDQTVQSNQPLTLFSITTAYFEGQERDNAMFYRVMDYLKHFINTEFSKRLSTSPTIEAAQRFTEAMNIMYQEALPNYKP